MFCCVKAPIDCVVKAVFDGRKVVTLCLQREGVLYLVQQNQSEGGVPRENVSVASKFYHLFKT